MGLGRGKGCFHGSCHPSRANSPWDLCAQERDAAVPEELLSTPLSSGWANMLSFPLRKTLPGVTNPTPPTGRDKGPVGAGEEQRVAARL